VDSSKDVTAFTSASTPELLERGLIIDSLSWTGPTAGGGLVLRERVTAENLLPLHRPFFFAKMNIVEEKGDVLERDQQYHFMVAKITNLEGLASIQTIDMDTLIITSLVSQISQFTVTHVR
jgi:hypothetical protein